MSTLSGVLDAGVSFAREIVFALTPYALCRKRDWSKEVVVITGGSGGLAKALLTQLLRRNPSRIVLLDLVAAPKIPDNRVVFYKLDVTNREKVVEAFARIRDEIGVPTILINNAGVAVLKFLTELTEADIKRTLEVNLHSMFWTCQAAVPYMISLNHGTIINIASVVGVQGAAFCTDYSASKFGVVGFSESLRRELQHTDVKVLTVYPGHISGTGMFQNFRYYWDKLMRSMTPGQVATAVLARADYEFSADVFLPGYLAFTSFGARFFPQSLMDWCFEMAGMNIARPDGDKPDYARMVR